MPDAMQIRELREGGSKQTACHNVYFLLLWVVRSNPQDLSASSTRSSSYFRKFFRDHERIIIFRSTAPELQKEKNGIILPIFLNTFRQYVFVLVNVVIEIFGWMDFTGHCTCKENYLNRFDLKAKQNCRVLGLVPICKVSQRSLLISLFVSVFSKLFLFTLLCCTFQH